MSRGLSAQQRQMLGMAVYVNRLTQGGHLAVKTGAPVADWLIPTVDYRGVKDLSWPLPAHLLKGLAFVEASTWIEKSNGVRQPAGSYFDLTTPQGRSAKASILRAIASLVREGLLIQAPERVPFPEGYVLTEAGMQRGRQYEAAFAPPLIFRAGLLVFPHEDPYTWLFYPLYAKLCSGALTLADVITTFASFTPCPVRRPVMTGTPEWESFSQWSTLRNHEVLAATVALLGEEGLQGFPPSFRALRTP